METFKVLIDHLVFDPNNYRLRSYNNYVFVDQNSLTLKSIQKKTQKLLSGDGNKNIHDLLESIRANGYLKVDNILVRQLKKDVYLVIEGNRRLAALKYLKDEYEKGLINIGKLDRGIFKTGIETVIYNYADEIDYKILMGLKHVSGNKKWDRYNQGKLLYELKKGLKVSDAEIGAKIGITKTEVQKEIRAYLATEKLIKDTSDENIPNFNPHEKMMIMLQLIEKPKLSKWVGWSDSKEDFTNKKNIKRFFDWIKPAVVFDDESEEYVTEDPIIISHKQVRKLEEIIDDKEALKLMEQERSFDDALDQNLSYNKKNLSNTLKKVESILRNIKTGISLNLDKNDKTSLHNIITICEKLLK